MTDIHEENEQKVASAANIPNGNTENKDDQDGKLCSDFLLNSCMSMRLIQK